MQCDEHIPCNEIMKYKIQNLNLHNILIRLNLQTLSLKDLIIIIYKFMCTTS